MTQVMGTCRLCSRATPLQIKQITVLNPKREFEYGGSGEKKGKWTCKPNSVFRLRGMTIIPLGATSLPCSCDLPEGSNAPSQYVSRQAGTPFLFGLAPCGVYRALDIAVQAVRSYRTFSPLSA